MKKSILKSYLFFQDYIFANKLNIETRIWNNETGFTDDYIIIDEASFSLKKELLKDYRILSKKEYLRLEEVIFLEKG